LKTFSSSPQSLVKNYVHITFSTKNRYPFINRYVSEELFNYPGDACLEIEYYQIIIGGEKDHVHLLVSPSRKMAF